MRAAALVVLCWFSATAAARPGAASSRQDRGPAGVLTADVAAAVSSVVGDDAEVRVVWAREAAGAALAMVRVGALGRPTLVEVSRGPGAATLSAVVGVDGSWRRHDMASELSRGFAPRELTLQRLGLLSRALAAYHLEMNAYPHVDRMVALVDGGGVVPEGLEPLVLPPGATPLEDGWGRGLLYEPLGGPLTVRDAGAEHAYARSYRVRSPGADGLADTSDDLCLVDGRVQEPCLPSDRP